ncbi:hypothetical protein [Paenibacillus methanolicus]|uniref:DUF4832 domain-containing protein n=1 Tax=Paenibacillus methanolicus TaxID=582686 RepID=A0A5S5BXZ1_9BACL|nr:hypothetical protein [Paenibacillus methanolicus]TYP71829.1 hypothetical protein BCM02_109107 [Paenibacillus methanolicus]
MTALRTVKPAEDTTTFFRSPAMGWVLYIDAFSMGEIQSFPEARDYWAMQDGNAEMASIFYLRVPWSIMEPEEGRYAWEEDENYRLMIRMALDRGLKLAFRVYVDSKDAFVQATPRYVFDAGAKGFANDDERPNFLTPYVHDPVFQRKLANFVQAFAAEYDDPAIVDFIDAQGLGWWGEMHGLDYLTDDQGRQVFEWLTNMYGDSFRRVLLGAQYGEGNFPIALQDWALREKGYVIRRDSFGSPVWFGRSHKDKLLPLWPRVPIFAENCYHGFKWRGEWYQEDGFHTLRDMMRQVVADAEELHANTLDLRYPQDASLWLREAPDLVRDFALRCGYRLVPTDVEYPASVVGSGSYKIRHAWKNAGFGVLPNHNPNWKRKYKPAFALLEPETGSVAYQLTDVAEPSDWIYGHAYAYETPASFDGVSAGEYRFATAIVNRDNGGAPEIRLAIEGERTAEGWHILGTITVD